MGLSKLSERYEVLFWKDAMGVLTATIGEALFSELVGAADGAPPSNRLGRAHCGAEN